MFLLPRLDEYLGGEPGLSFERAMRLDESLGGITGGAAYGCFVFNNCQVVSLLGAIPEEFKTWQALPYKPFFARLMADWML